MSGTENEVPASLPTSPLVESVYISLMIYFSLDFIIIIIIIIIIIYFCLSLTYNAYFYGRNRREIRHHKLKQVL